MSEMSKVEEVAGALLKELARDDEAYVRDNGDGSVTLDGHFDLKALARKAIEAMREPTMAMCIEGAYHNFPKIPDAYRAMIDEALKDS